MDTRKAETDTRLTAACRANLIDQVRLIIAEKADVNEPSPTGTLPINIAVLGNHLDIVQELLDAKADVNKPDIKGGRPAIQAAYQDNTAILTRLINANADVNLPDMGTKATALILAAQENRVENVKLLLQSKANVNQYNENNGASPLTITCQKGHETIAALLLNANADPNQSNPKKGTTPAIVAARAGHSNILKLLIEAKADPDQQHLRNPKVKPIHSALTTGKADAAQLLIEHGIEVQDIDMNNALKTNNLALVHSLIKKGCTVDAQALESFLSSKNVIQRDSRILLCLQKLSHLKSLEAEAVRAEPAGEEKQKAIESEVKLIDSYRRKLDCLHSSVNVVLLFLLNQTALGVGGLPSIVLDYVDGSVYPEHNINYLGCPTVDSWLRITKYSIEKIQKKKEAPLGFFDATIAKIDLEAAIPREMPLPGIT